MRAVVCVYSAHCGRVRFPETSVVLLDKVAFQGPLIVPVEEVVQPVHRVTPLSTVCDRAKCREEEPVDLNISRPARQQLRFPYARLYIHAFPRSGNGRW